LAIPIKELYEFIFFPMRVTCPAHLSLDLICLTMSMSGEGGKMQFFQTCRHSLAFLSKIHTTYGKAIMQVNSQLLFLRMQRNSVELISL
jgi:hypothetical protein